MDYKLQSIKYIFNQFDKNFLQLVNKSILLKFLQSGFREYRCRVDSNIFDCKIEEHQTFTNFLGKKSDLFLRRSFKAGEVVSRLLSRLRGTVKHRKNLTGMKNACTDILIYKNFIQFSYYLEICHLDVKYKRKILHVFLSQLFYIISNICVKWHAFAFTLNFWSLVRIVLRLTAARVARRVSNWTA